MKAVAPANLEPLESPVSDVASVPRRFGVGVLMILMTAFAVLFAGMQTFGARPEVFIIVAVLFLAVTLGQILLFQGKKPRRASLLAGGVVFPLEVLGLALYALGQSREGIDLNGLVTILGFTIPGLICTIPAGTLFGYLAGCVMASVFLFQERYHRRSHRPVSIELLPFTGADFETLIAWVHYPQLFHLWSRDQFRYPLDQDQLAAHLARVAGQPPNGLCFKAVCGEMQEMVAYVELANIDRATLRSRIELAIVDPTRNDRDQLSTALIWEIMQQAFHGQGLEWLDVVLHRSEAQSLECFCKHGFYDAYAKKPGDAPDEYRKLIRSHRY
jgi:hypothetical protein